MELTEIKSKGISWGQAATELNNNFNKVNSAVEQVKNATTKNKGFYSSLSALIAAYPTASIGDKAYVDNSGASGEMRYKVYQYDGSWKDTGKEFTEESVNLGNYYDKEQIDAMIKPVVYDGGRADSTYGGAMIIDCGTALHS